MHLGDGPDLAGSRGTSCAAVVAAVFAELLTAAICQPLLTGSASVLRIHTSVFDPRP